MKAVDFFIVGAPKCGTTSLAKYLGKHPLIFFSKRKEPHFFCTDFPKRQFDKTVEDYHKNNFDNFRHSQMTYGEGSTFYLYSKNSIHNIFNYNSAAKIIIMLRNPSDLIFSLFEFRKYGGSELNVDVETIWSLNNDRKLGQAIPSNWRYDNELLYYDEIAAFGTQIERVYSFFEPEDVKVILFEDFINETKRAYMEVLYFLGIEYDGRTVFSRENTAKHNRYNWARQLLRRKFYDEVQIIKKKCGVESLEPALMKIGLVKNGKGARLSEDMREEITAHYRGEVEKLEDLIRRDLTAWR